MATENQTMMQYFHWDYPSDGSLWQMIIKESEALSKAGISELWLPPPTKAFEAGNAGYGIYDLWDLGEFNQKGSIRTKYGTRSELENALAAIHNAKMKAYLDIVFNHKAGADAPERVKGVPVDPENRNNNIGEEREIEAWTNFRFEGRGDKYSKMKWKHDHFDSVDYDNISRSMQIYRICNRPFDSVVSTDKGNYDFLMFADIDSSNQEVRTELKNWGKWMVEEIKFDGFRIDAAKHIGTDLMSDWLDYMDKTFSDRKLYAVGEYFDEQRDELHNYMDTLKGRVSLFDFPLFFNFRAASENGANFDMRNIVKGTLLESRPQNAATFVENHDTSRDHPVQEWFKPLAYAIILLHENSHPCIFFLDYYGGNGKPGHRQILDKLLKARNSFAYGRQINYFDHQNIAGFTRLGDLNHPYAMAVIMSAGSGGEKRMNTGKGNTVFYDITGNISDKVKTDKNGDGIFRCNGGSVSVWVEEKLNEETTKESEEKEEKPSEKETDNLVINFKRPQDWGSNIFIHYWNTIPERKQTQWPGEQMEKICGDCYRFSFENVKAARFVINDGNGHQTIDLGRDRSGFYKDGKWYDTDPDDHAPEVKVSPRGGLYNEPIKVKIESSNITDEIYYTFKDPSMPGIRWERYTEPLDIKETCTLAVRASCRGGQLGMVRLYQYEISKNVSEEEPQIVSEHKCGIYEAPFDEVFSVTAGKNTTLTAYYTIDGKEPDETSQVYLKLTKEATGTGTKTVNGKAIRIKEKTNVRFLLVDSNGKKVRKSFCYSIEPKKASSDFRDETIYFVVTTRFYDGNESTDFFCRDRIQFANGQHVDPHWRGDFRGLIDQLDYIRELGFTAIWITPPVENRSGLDYHGYHPYDWTRIDPRLESEGATYADLIREIHERGMKIIQDVVINHSSQYGIRNKVWIDRLPIKYYVPRGSEQGKIDNGPYKGNLGSYASPFREDNDNPLAPEWFRRRQESDPHGTEPLQDPLTSENVPNPGYNPQRFFGTDPKTLDKTWYHQEGFIAGGDWEAAAPLEHRHMAGDCLDLNTENDTVKDYLMHAIDKYLEMGVDALRIDTAKHIERDNLLEYVNHWKTIKPNLFVFGEVLVKGTGWGDLFGDDNGPSQIRPWWYTRLGHDPKNPQSGGNSGFSVLDFSLFSTFRDNIQNGNFNGIGGVLSRDWVYGDPTTLVTFFQNHDVGPDNDFRYRFGGNESKAAMAYNLLWTIRGIPCLYYGEEIKFMGGAPQDIVSNNDTLNMTGRAYFGDNLTPDNIDKTKSHVLFRHIQRLNLIRKNVPALCRGTMKNMSEWGGGMSFIRDCGNGNCAAVGLAAGNDVDITLNVENGNYADAVTGNRVSVTDGRLQFHVKAFSAGIYVRNGDGKIGNDLEYLR